MITPTCSEEVLLNHTFIWTVCDMMSHLMSWFYVAVIKGTVLKVEMQMLLQKANRSKLISNLISSIYYDPNRVPSGHQLDWLKSPAAGATVCATGAWGFKELGVLEESQERKPPEAISGILKQPEICIPTKSFSPAWPSPPPPFFSMDLYWSQIP